MRENRINEGNDELPLSDWILGSRPDQIEYFIAQLVLLCRGGAGALENRAVVRGGLPTVSLDGKILVSPLFSVADARVFLDKTLECCQSHTENAGARFLSSRLIADRERFDQWPQGDTSGSGLPWPIISRPLREELEELLGGRVRFQALQSCRVRRNHFKRCLNGLGWSLPPLPWKVTCENGRAYKLLKWSSKNQMKQYGIVETARALKGKAFVPKIIFNGENYLLVEYRSGRSVDVGTSEFSKKFGLSLACIHSHQSGFLTKEQVIQIAQSYLKEIEWREPSTKQILSKVRACLFSSIPEVVPTGTTYADLKADNFLLDEGGELFFPDLGSFQMGQMLDVFLVGSPLFNSICFSDFRNAYLSSGGSEVVFLENDWLKLLNALKMAEFFLRIHDRFSIFNWRMRKNYKIWAKDKIEQLSVLVGEG